MRMHISRAWPVAMVLTTAASIHAPAAPSKPLTLQQAVDQVQAASGGRVLTASTVRSRRGGKYRIKVLTPDGRVRVIEVDPRNHHQRPAAAKAKTSSKENH